MSGKAQSIVTCTFALLASWIAFGFAARSQELVKIPTLTEQWIGEIRSKIAKSGGNAPERGDVRLGTFDTEPAATLVPVPFNRHLSLFVTDIDTVSQIKFSDAMQRLVDDNRNQGGDGLLTKELLFHQWWDTANKAAGLGLGPHCDDTPPKDNVGKFTYDCPRKEGEQATDAKVFTDEPDGASAYAAIAVINRFDLLSDAEKIKGSNLVRYPDCGEYRIIFARNSGRTRAPAPGSTTIRKEDQGDRRIRNLISFEARVKNPNPRAERRRAVPLGCRRIVQFWLSLSKERNGTERGKLLANFFLKGEIPGHRSIKPVISIANLSFDGGQIRTNQFVNTVTMIPGTPGTPGNPEYGIPGTPGTPATVKVEPDDWVLREFRTILVGRKLMIVPDSIKETPGTDLFRTGTTDARFPLLVNAIRHQMNELLGGRKAGQYENIGDINAIRFSLPKRGPNAFETHTSKQAEGDILAAAKDNLQLETVINDALAAAKAPTDIKPREVINRIRTQTCAGCHQFSDTKKNGFGFDEAPHLGGGAKWPTKACGDVNDTCRLGDDVFLLQRADLHPPMQFTHVSETILTPSVADRGTRWRYAISSTLECLLDFREKFFAEAIGLPRPSVNHCP